jgi:hypothetical protein
MSKTACALVAVSWFGLAGNSAWGQAGNYADSHYREWRQIVSYSATWDALAASCPTDGMTPCGAGGEWIWGTGAQVLELMSDFDPSLATGADTGGASNFFSAQSFLSVFTPSFSFCGTYNCGAFVSGWTASKEATGRPIVGSAGWGNTPVSIDGSIGVGPVATVAEAATTRQGAFFWRPTGPGVIAYNDAGSVASPAGGTAVANVLANDWIAGVRATVASVSLRQDSTSDPQIALDTGDGSVDVLLGAAAGTHTLTYTICSRADASQCDSAIVTVTVRPYLIDAVNDSGVASPAVTSSAIASVLANDTLGTTRATIATVAASVVSIAPADAGVTFDANDGSVDVAAGTALGAYVITYRICERANPTNCDSAQATVTVRNNPIYAVSDYVRGSSKTGGTVIASVLANDQLNGVRPAAGSVQLTATTALPYGITLNTSTGAVTVAPKTSSGVYRFGYQICESVAPTNCSSTTVTVELSGRDR